jgi:hypothetical protein
MRAVILSAFVLAAMSSTAFAASPTNSNVNTATATSTGSSATSQGSNVDMGSTVDKTVYAPDLSGLVGTSCMGSTTASGGSGLFALGFGTSWVDHDCQRRETAKYLSDMGYPKIGFALLCKNDGVAEAAAQVGVTCPGAPKLTEAPQRIVPMAANGVPESWYESPYDR